MSAALPFFETIERKVLFAVELIDPVTRLPVSDLLKVKASGLDHGPIVSHSRRFVWLREADKWPSSVSVSSRDPRFSSIEKPEPAPPRPQSFPEAKPEERLLTVFLPTTSVYEFDSGITAIRGSLYKSLPSENSPRRGDPIQGATVFLAYLGRDAGNSEAGIPFSDKYVRAPFPVTTDAAGQFAVFVKLIKKAGFVPDIEPPPMLRVRIEVENGSETKCTSADFPFLSDPRVAGRIREGEVHPQSVQLGWAELNNV